MMIMEIDVQNWKETRKAKKEEDKYKNYILNQINNKIHISVYYN